MRWSEEEYAAYERRQRNGGTLGALDLPAPSREGPTKAKAARARGNQSPLESQLYGNLRVMQLEPEQQYRFHPERKWRFDFAFPAELVAVEIDGGIFAAENGEEAGAHVRGARRIKDYEKRNAAAELGWLVLCYGPPQVRDGSAALQIHRLVSARRLLVVEKVLEHQDA